MNVFEILKTSEENHSVRKFLGYHIIGKNAPSGQQGLVTKAQNSAIGKMCAIKFARPIDEDPQLRNKSAENFKREIKILASLHHRNVARIITGGTARWNDSNLSWEICEGFASASASQSSDDIYFYVMEFIEQGLEDAFGPLTAANYKASDAPKSLATRAALFEELAVQLCAGLTHCHTNRVTHKDIKFDNIRFAPSDNTFILVDFGFAHHGASMTSSLKTLVVKENPDYFAEVEREFILVDIAQLASVLDSVFETVKGKYDTNRQMGIKRALQKARNSNLDQRFRSAEEFLTAIRPYFLQAGQAHLPSVLRINEFLTSSLFGRFDSKVRIPISGSILWTQEVRHIVDTPDFQRLRGVRQLGPTTFVYPGATHTRFEHSLGTYALALRYIGRLSELPNFRALTDNPDNAIKIVVLATLLHDIGHYPYSHWVEELRLNKESFPKHEERAGRIIQRDPIRKIIEEEWGVKPDDVAKLIDDTHTPRHHLLYNSIINSAIDVDKIDYLIRDSIHCGVNYGRGIDVERLLDSLCVVPENDRLCLTEKGRSALISLIAARNIMYQEVYWHKTVRACQAMFKRFFFEYVKNQIQPLNEIAQAMNLSDDAFLSYLFKNVPAGSPLLSLVEPFVLQGRKIYKVAFVYTKQQKLPSAVRSFFNPLFDAQDYQKVLEKSNNLAKKLGIPENELLLEATPVGLGEQYNLNQLRIVDSSSLSNDKTVDHEVPESVKSLNTYLSEHQRAFIFCKETHYSSLRRHKPDDWASILADI